MRKDGDLIDLLRHARHEWLNAIQLIKGNLELNHQDRAMEIINGIITKSQNEAKITNLHIPKTAFFLLTYNWFPHPLKADIEILGCSINLEAYDEALLNLVQSLLELFEHYASQRSENHILMSFELINGELFIVFDFSGKLEKRMEYTEAVNRLQVSPIHLVEQEIAEHETYFRFKLKLKKDGYNVEAK